MVLILGQLNLLVLVQRLGHIMVKKLLVTSRDRLEDETSYIIILGTFLVFFHSTFVLNLGSTYYVFVYFAPLLELSWDSLIVPLCVSILVGDSLVVDWGC